MGFILMGISPYPLNNRRFTRLLVPPEGVHSTIQHPPCSLHKKKWSHHLVSAAFPVSVLSVRYNAALVLGYHHNLRWWSLSLVFLVFCGQLGSFFDHFFFSIRHSSVCKQKLFHCSWSVLCEDSNLPCLRWNHLHLILGWSPVLYGIPVSPQHIFFCDRIWSHSSHSYEGIEIHDIADWLLQD